MSNDNDRALFVAAMKMINAATRYSGQTDDPNLLRAVATSLLGAAGLAQFAGAPATGAMLEGAADAIAKRGARAPTTPAPPTH